MQRYLDEIVRRDLNKKMVLLTGSRQVGKTTLARQVLQTASNWQYFNYDTPVDRKTITAQSWNPDANTPVYDGKPER